MTAGEQVVARCRALAEVSDERGRLTRPFATAAMARANAKVGTWMRAAGLAVSVDAMGNLVGRRPGTDPAAGTLLLGSHLDSVRDAGAFDGPLGVLVAVEALARLGPLPFGVDVYGFADEEGLRYGTAYLGSRTVAGTLDPAVLMLADDDDVTVAEALRAFGGDPAALPAAARTGERLLGYVEVHMEQGPVLEREGAAVGVVSAIAGATRAELRFQGQPGHAGTVPMEARRDAACAAAAWVLEVEAAGRATPGLLATVGRLTAHPGATNVIPGRVLASLDVRHAVDADRLGTVATLHAAAGAAAAARDVSLDWQVVLDNPAVAVDPGLTALLDACVHDRTGAPAPHLPSGAGHDAVALSALCPVAMLFVRCAGGLSHHPAEDVAAGDAALAVDVLAALLGRLAAA